MREEGIHGLARWICVFLTQCFIRIFLRTRRSKGVWIFTSWCGTVCGDNPKYLVQYVVRMCPTVTPVWIFSDQNLISSLKAQGYHAVCSGSIQANAWASLAKVCIYSDLPLFGIYLNPKVLRVNVWHGMPMKDIGLLPSRDDLVIAMSKESQRILTSAFDLPSENIVITGQPKNDILFHPIDRPKSLDKWGKACRIVTYMPTYRGSFNTILEYTRSNPTGFFLDKCLHGSLRELFASLLEEQNLVFVIKPHLRNRPVPAGLSRVVVMDEYTNSENTLDSHELMSITDVLITDYSSVYFDFLLTDRPFILYTPDLDAYLQSQKLYYDIDELAAGCLAQSEEELLGLLVSVLNEPARNQDKRMQLRDRFNVFRDGESSRRVLEQIEARLTSHNRGIN